MIKIERCPNMYKYVGKQAFHFNDFFHYCRLTNQVQIYLKAELLLVKYIPTVQA
jgi:hypothetical protein